MNKPPNIVTVLVPFYLEPGASAQFIQEGREKAARAWLKIYGGMMLIATEKLRRVLPMDLYQDIRSHSSADTKFPLGGGFYAQALDLQQLLHRANGKLARINRKGELSEEQQAAIPALCIPQIDKFFNRYPATPAERQSSRNRLSQKELDLPKPEEASKTQSSNPTL